jgi:hypothetical protein
MHACELFKECQARAWPGLAETQALPAKSAAWARQPDALCPRSRHPQRPRYTRAETMVGYWGMGLYWGKASSNNKAGHMIGHIKDIGHDPANPLTRLYATTAAQP